MALYSLFALTTILISRGVYGRFRMEGLQGAGAGSAAWPWPGGGASLPAGGVSRRRALDRICLAALFCALTALSCLRIDVGNDYAHYVDLFHEICFGKDPSIVVTEPGFNFVVRAVYALSGFENYLLVFGLFGAATVFLFLKAMDGLSDNFFLSFSMFLLMGIYFRSFTMVRYYFALALSLCMLEQVLRREYGRFALTVLFASLFHKSALVILPLYLLAAVPWKRWMAALIAGAAILAAIFHQPVLSLALKFFPTFQNTVYLTQGLGLAANASGILRCLLLFALAFFSRKEPVWQRKDCRFYLKLNFLGFLLYTCGSFLPLVSRLAYFLVTSQIFLAPALLGSLSGKKRRVAFAFTALFLLVYFVCFLLQAPQDGFRLLPYQSWVFTEKEWINGTALF